MTVLELRFPAGRFHATPWGRHVNEGAVEWPPSPWRILRALIATRHLKAQEEVSEELLQALIVSLAEELPIYRLPSASQGHTRHYMPYNEGKNEKTTKVFDTFVNIAPNEVVQVAWNRSLPADQEAALSLLAKRIGYFGRAESLVEAKVCYSFRDGGDHLKPLDGTGDLPPGTELIRLLAPMPAPQYQNWRSDFEKEALAALGPKPTKNQLKKLPTVPPDLYTALHAVTAELQAAGWNTPPGATYVGYARSEKAFTIGRSRKHEPADLRLTVARFAVVSSVQPRITQVISVAHRVHQSLCKFSQQAPVFTGHGADGTLLTDHTHAHIFCESNGLRDQITHITVWAKMGFEEPACMALRRLNKVWGYGDHDLRLVLLGMGQPNDFPECAFFRRSKIWRSLTPFVSTRHGKTFRDGRPKMDANGWQIGSSGHDLLRLLSHLLPDSDAKISQTKAIKAGDRVLRPIQFQTIRHEGCGRRGSGDAGGFTITFPTEIDGPLAFGYGAHFGLGLFVPADS